MRRFKWIGLAALLMAAAASSGQAHSLKKLESMLGERERYFQALDKNAPEFSLRDHTGKIVRLALIRDKIIVLNFVYTRCPDVCPLHAERIADIQEMINQTPMKAQVQFISITTDPANDTPEILNDYGSTHGLDPANWTFLTSGPDRPTATRELAKQYGHKFTLTKEGYQMHGVVTHVIDREGRWRANFYGLKFKPTSLVLFVNALVNDIHRPAARDSQSFWDKIRKLF